MYSTRDGGVWYDERRLASKDALVVDVAELRSVGVDEGVVHMTMPDRVDMVMVAGSRVVGMESKRPSDLVSSYYSRRLARQIRRLRAVVDVACLVLRGGVPDFENDECMINLVRLQTLGVYVLPLPDGDRECVRWLLEYREMLADGSRAALAALAGGDNPLKRTGTLVSRVKGLGATRADRLMRLALRKVTDEELKKEGFGRAMIQRLRKEGV
jgi:hypothetical protein